MSLSGTGIWSSGLRAASPGERVDLVAELEALGYTSLWIPSGGGRSLEAAEDLLAAGGTITVATGIFSFWGQSADDTAATHRRLQDTYGGRFLLGIGVSHAPLVERFTPGESYAKPVQAMRSFLDGLDAAETPVPVEERVLAALGPKMLELARDRAGGAHPYNVTPEHTAEARAALGPDKLLVPEQGVVLAADAEEGRRRGREFLAHYLTLPNYANNLRRMGFTEDDLAGGGSDRLVDGLVAWGDEEAIAARVRAHREAGADSVCVQVISPGGIEGMTTRPLEAWRRLAPALTR